MMRSTIAHSARVHARFTAPLVALCAMACASGGSTFRSGVGDAMLEHPPYYAGLSAAVATAGTPIGHLPIVFQPGAAQASIFDPRFGPDTPIGRLLAKMNGALDSMSEVAGPRLVEGGAISAVSHAETVGPPDVRFGCLTVVNLPGEECAARGDSALGRAGQRMRLAVGRPSAAWIRWHRDVQRENGVARTLVLTLEVGQYLPRQSGWRGDKVVELGTGYTARLPWLTSLETPVLVLQLTGAVVDSSGRALRIGAEGIVAVRTTLAASAAGAQRMLTDADVEVARTLRRDDLAGRPLAWRVAQQQLVARLTGGDSTIHQQPGT